MYVKIVVMNKIKKCLLLLFCLLSFILVSACNNVNTIKEDETIEESILQQRIDSGYFDEADSRYYWCFNIIRVFIINSSETSNKKFCINDFPELDILVLSEEVMFDTNLRRSLYLTLNIDNSLEQLKPFVIKLTNNKYVYDVEYDGAGIG